jgi:N-acetylglucosamine-6-phosphate deacetylase
MSVLIKNCRIVSPDVDLCDAAVEIDGETIKHVYRPGDLLPAAGDCLDAGGAMLVPGFIDMHFHGGVGFDVTDGSAEGIARIAEAKLREGVTTMCPATLTLPEDKLAVAMRNVADYRADERFARIAGVHLEGPFINPDCTGAQNPAFVRTPDIAEVDRLREICDVSIVSYAVEVEGAEAFTRALCERGIVPSCGHSAATFEQLQGAKRNGLRHLTHFCNQMTKLHHREIGMVGAGLYDDELLVELICDAIHLCPDMIRLVFKCKPIETIALITDAMSATGLEDGTYDLGGLEVAVANGAARLASNGALAGSTLQYHAALKNVAEVTGLPLSQLVKTTSLNQALSLGFSDRGRIEPGYLADLAILDSEFEPIAVFVSGEKRYGSL